MKPVYIPARIDDPPHIMIVAADEIAPVLIGLSFGIMIGQAAICTILGLALTFGYRKFRDNHQDGYFLHLLYYSGFVPAKSKLMINPFIRRMFP